MSYQYEGVSLKEKVAVIIGGTSGIGRAIALGMAKEGANVVPTSRDPKKVEKAVQEVKKSGSKSLLYPVDVTDEEQVEELVRRVVGQFNRVDILVNSAGAFIKKPALHLTGEEWDRVLDVNLKGAFLACKAVGQYMIQKKNGSIINIASIASYVGNDETLAYCASKGGLVQLTKALAREWAQYNVRVNAIAPGPIMTPANRALLKPGSPRLQTFYQRIPMKRLGEPQELVGAAVYLASDAASYVTGSCLVVDGGFLSSGV